MLFPVCQAEGMEEQRFSGVICEGVLASQAVGPRTTPLTLCVFPSPKTSEPCPLPAQRFGCSPEAV